VEISRVTRTKEEAGETYNKLSKWYDLLAGYWERKPRDIGLRMLGVKEGEKVLEIGFGTGRAIISLAESVGNSGRVYGIDISSGMHEVAGSAIMKADLSERVEFICGDAIELSFETNFFDAIFMSFTLELFDTPEIPIVLQECNRVLKKNGRICVVAMSKRGKAGLMMKIYEWAHEKFPKYIDCRPIFVEEALKNAGCKIISIKKMSLWRLPVEIVLAKM